MNNYSTKSWLEQIICRLWKENLNIVMWYEARKFNIDFNVLFHWCKILKVGITTEIKSLILPYGEMYLINIILCLSMTGSSMWFSPAAHISFKRCYLHDDFEQVEEQYLTCIQKIVNKYKIHDELIINWNKPRINFVQISNWTMEETSTKKVKAFGSNERQITALSLRASKKWPLIWVKITRTAGQKGFKLVIYNTWLVIQVDS